MRKDLVSELFVKEWKRERRKERERGAREKGVGNPSRTRGKEC